VDREATPDAPAAAVLTVQPTSLTASRTLASILDARGLNSWDFFLSHFQAESGDIVALLATKLEHRGFRPWYDKWPGKGDASHGYIDVTAAGMQAGVQQSAIFLLFLSHGVFSRPFCRLEILTALKARRPIVTLMETDARRGAFDFGTGAKEGVPSSFYPIIDKITSEVMAIPLRRNVEEQALMLNRIERIYLEKRAKILDVSDADIACAERGGELPSSSPAETQDESALMSTQVEEADAAKKGRREHLRGQKTAVKRTCGPLNEVCDGAGGTACVIG
jgi:hypothetical protein